MSTVHIVLPNDIDDPRHPSGGNHYDRQVCHALPTAGWTVVEHAVAGAWPRPSAADRGRLGDVLGALPDGAAVLLDGLVAADRARRPRPPRSAPASRRAGPHAGRRPRPGSPRARTRDPGPGRRGRRPPAPGAAGAWSICTGSPPTGCTWPGRGSTRPRSRPDRGTGRRCSASRPSPPTRDTTCWCGRWPSSPTCRGPAPASARSIGTPPSSISCDSRCGRPGSPTGSTSSEPRPGRDLDAPLRVERICSCSPHAGRPTAWWSPRHWPAACPWWPPRWTACRRRWGTRSEGRPGLLVPPEDPAALAAGLRRWLTDADLRHRLRRRARERRTWLTGWDHTARQVATALSAATANVAVGR